jgi:prefoldin subunit 5
LLESPKEGFYVNTPATGDDLNRQELTGELASLDQQLRDLSQQWEEVERTITEKIRRRRELLSLQEERQEDHSEEISRLQSDVYLLRDRIDMLRDTHLDFSALYRIVQQAKD